jgi:hypothetical protein
LIREGGKELTGSAYSGNVRFADVERIVVALRFLKSSFIRVRVAETAWDSYADENGRKKHSENERFSHGASGWCM